MVEVAILAGRAVIHAPPSAKPTTSPTTQPVSVVCGKAADKGRREAASRYLVADRVDRLVWFLKESIKETSIKESTDLVAELHRNAASVDGHATVVGRGGGDNDLGAY